LTRARAIARAALRDRSHRWYRTLFIMSGRGANLLKENSLTSVVGITAATCRDVETRRSS